MHTKTKSFSFQNRLHPCNSWSLSLTIKSLFTLKPFIYQKLREPWHYMNCSSSTFEASNFPFSFHFFTHIHPFFLSSLNNCISQCLRKETKVSYISLKMIICKTTSEKTSSEVPLPGEGVSIWKTSYLFLSFWIPRLEWVFENFWRRLYGTGACFLQHPCHHEWRQHILKRIIRSFEIQVLPFDLV